MKNTNTSSEFYTFIRDESRNRLPENLISTPELLAEFNYPEEIKMKNEALKKYFSYMKFHGNLENIVESPLPRKYRTTTKKRLFYNEKKYFLSTGYNQPEKSMLDPEYHSIIYKTITQFMNRERSKSYLKHINFVIIRGSYQKFTLIFNIDVFNAELINKFKHLSDQVLAACKEISSIYLFLGEKDSKYYNEFADENFLKLKKLYGSKKITIPLNSRFFSFYPDSFSQINLSIVPAMIQKIGDNLVIGKDCSLIDLYCGYGLFSLSFIDKYKSVIGIEVNRSSIKSAVENITGNTNVRFLCDSITVKSIANLPDTRSKEIFIIDPPRNGTLPGVIENITERRPEQIVHIFCNIDNIPSELARWQHNGYVPRRIIPLDMFPGTPEIETMIFFGRK